MPKLSSKGIWMVTYPVLISLLMQHMIGVIDSLFLGRLGEVELGAAGLGGVYYLTFFMLGFGFSIGAQIIMARRNGENNQALIGPVFMQSLIFLFALAPVAFLLIKLVSPSLLHMMINSEEVYASTLEYVDWRCYGYFFSFAGLTFRAFFVGTTRTGILTVNAALMVVANSVLNYLLIFGKCGFPAWGVAGAAIASALSELISLCFMFAYTFIKVDWRRYRLFCFSGLGFSLLWDVLKTSMWTMMQYFASMGVWFVFFVAVEHLGEQELAISNIVRNVSAVLYMFVAAFSATASSLVSNMIGAGGSRHVLALCRKLIRMCFLSQLPFVVLVMLFPSAILRCFTSDAELIAHAVPSMIVMASSYFIHAPSLIYLSSVTGTGSTRPAMIMEFLTLGVYLTSVVILIFEMRVDVAVSWTTEHIYASVLLALSYWYMKKGYWMGKKI